MSALGVGIAAAASVHDNWATIQYYCDSLRRILQQVFRFDSAIHSDLFLPYVYHVSYTGSLCSLLGAVNFF